jgi:hypothetical protein
MTNDTTSPRVQIQGKTYLVKEDADSCLSCAFLKETADFCREIIKPQVRHLGNKPHRGGCATGEHIFIEDTHEAILQYIERKLGTLEDDNE